MDIFISLPAQTLEVFSGVRRLFRYSVSTARNGAGELKGSFMTPRGRHVVRAKIGENSPENAVFVARRPTGEIWSPGLSSQFPDRDWILTRILWLSGKEPGRNRLGQVDTMRRYIYLHGSPDTVSMGAPGSIGCVRMRNADILELFSSIPVYTAVNIGEFAIDSVRECGAEALFQAIDHVGETIGDAVLRADGHIHRLEVAEAWRRKGVATQLLRAIAAYARDKGLAAIELRVASDSAGWLQRLGFNAETHSASYVSLRQNLSV